MATVKTKKEFDAMSTPDLITYLDALPTKTYDGYVGADVKMRYYLGKYGKMFANEIKGTNIFFSAVIPQTIGENGWGRSGVFVNGNNFGGVRYNKNIHSDFYQSPKTGKWAKWSTPEEGVKGYIANLKGSRYANAINNTSTPEQQIIKLIEAGYDPESTPKEYLSKIKGNINRVRKLTGLGRII
jgi:hypothetical protein